MATKIPRPPSALEERLAFDMKALKFPPFEREYPFNEEGRRWRFDFAWPEHKLAVECHGLVASGKGGHQTISGLSHDLEKHNAATMQGWRVLYFPRAEIFSGRALILIHMMLYPSAFEQK